MRKIGFNDQCLSLVMTCVSMVDFVVLVNGQSCRHFSLFRGFRQGDPLSLYMFLIISDVFPRSIQCVVEEGSIKGMQFNHQSPSMSHMFFADDTLIFLHATPQNAWNITKILNAYCQASGQQINLHKSSVYLGANVPMTMSNYLCDILGIPIVSDLGMYLGLPFIWSR